MTFAQPFHDYEILDRVGAGAMGTVFKARHKRLNRIVALKVLKPSLARDSRYVDRLKREARIVASLSHPNIVTGFDLGEEGGYHYFVMEFVEGKSLRGLLAEWGMFAEEYVHRVARQVAQALDHAYQRGVIHRDIKPGNILIEESGSVKLTDMGLAKGPADLTLTRDGATVGTPQYISPEQARNPHDVDVRTDLYSLGATLYHMATGVPPFRGDTMAELITNVLHELPVSPKAINSALSDGMSLVIRKLLAKDLTIRYQTPRDLLDDLDRLERSLPPQIDPQRLSAEAGERVRWWPRALLGAAAVALLGLAWWIGLQMHEPVDRQPTAAEFLQELDAELAAMPTPAARQTRLRTIAAAVPAGGELALQQRQKQAEADVQAAVDRVVNEFGGERFAELALWLRDPTVWPDRARFEREKLQPRLLAEVGFAPGQLPPSVRQQRLEELRQTIDRTLAERDGDVIERFGLYLRTTVPALAEERLRASDFAGADRIWETSELTFCDGVRMPLRERLSEATRAALRERHQSATRAAINTVQEEERVVETALRAEVDAVCADLDARLGRMAPDVVARSLQRFRQQLEHDWPPASSFRAGRNPWPDLDRRFGTLAAAIDVTNEHYEATRFAGRCDLVWRVFCHGTPDDAIALLADAAPPGGAHVAAAAKHRSTLAAARAVEAAIVQALRGNQPTLAFRRGSAVDSLEVRAESAGDGWRLVGNTIHQPPRSVHLGELRVGELLRQLGQERDPLLALAPAERALGVAVYRMLSDDLGGIEPLLATMPGADRQFLTDEVWPRLMRARGEQPTAALDRDSVFKRLREARDAAAKHGSLDELAQALFAANHTVAEHERTPAEAQELQRADSWLQLERRRQELATELQQAATQGAEVDVRIVGEELAADVTLRAPALQREDGWHAHGDVVGFAYGGGPWSELARRTLRGDPGLPPTVPRTTLQVDFVMPPTSVGRRLWVFEFRGIAVVLVVGANDTVHAALIEGDLRREEVVQRAFLRAVSGVLAPSKAVAVPGGVHRLTMEVVANPSTRTHAWVRVLFEGVELVPRERRPLDAQRPPTFAIHPQQDLAVHRVVVRGEGLAPQ